jgi:hypothetical protein
MDGSVFQAILLAFLFMAYLILVFVIVGDLMRDHELSGWWKAVWIVALILIPWLTDCSTSSCAVRGWRSVRLRGRSHPAGTG